ncbi:hypothetical protein ACQEU5_14360 [Marinactinospora thermotolerans]|uniref:hypothetical protein n=1 Tax=Marinactinospora thermotolerans TaxID=531310 RepID=UPI001F1BEC09|nr:hypothetical protein [Marinactinospora thermotolerans]
MTAHGEQTAALREATPDVGVVRHSSGTSGLESGPVVRRSLGVLLPVGHPRAGERCG